MLVLSILCWLIFSYISLSLIEYWAHRYPMHSAKLARSRLGRLFFRDAFESHAKLHHGRFYRNFEGDPDPAAKFVSLELNPGYMLYLTSVIWIPLWFISTAGTITFMACVFLHGLLWTTIHREMHEPEGRWFSKLLLYRYWYAYHREHHEHPGWNFNVVCPLMDHVFGTYRRPPRPFVGGGKPQ